VCLCIGAAAVTNNFGRNTAAARVTASGQVTRTTADNFDPLATGGEILIKSEEIWGEIHL
jgi:hypothetical protein